MDKENESCRKLLAASGITIGALALFCATASPEAIRLAVGGVGTSLIISCGIAVCAASPFRGARAH